MRRKWNVIRAEKLISNRWLTVQKEHVVLPNGQEMEDFYSVTIPDAAAIVALDTEGNVILKREYKHPAGETLIEIPAGMFEVDETDPLVVAQRELLEETGYISEEWHYFGATVESSAKLTNRMHIFLAQNCRKISEQKLDPTEMLEVLKVPLEEAVSMVMRNEICCNSSANGILKAYIILSQGWSTKE